MTITAIMEALRDAIASQLHAIGYQTEEEIAEHGELTLRQKQLLTDFAAGLSQEFTERLHQERAKPKREEGKWYAGKHRNYRAPCPWLFIDGHLRERATGIGYEEYDFDWISDTPLDLRKDTANAKG